MGGKSFSLGRMGKKLSTPFEAFFWSLHPQILKNFFELLNVYHGTLYEGLYKLKWGKKVFPSDIWGKNCVISDQDR